MQFPDAADTGLHERDLGPLAWVAAELRRGLEGAVKSLRRFIREAEAAGHSDPDLLDTGALRVARQQLHQVSGALEMVGMEPTAVVVRSMEATINKFLQNPAACDEPAVATIERAGFAVGEFLDTVLAGKHYPAVGLFPQYREVQALAGADRAHPADLWPAERRSAEPSVVGAPEPLAYGAAARAQLDQAVLSVVKSGDAAAARRLSELSQRFGVAHGPGQAQIFWRVSAGFFEALGLDLLPRDAHSKRVASRVLMQYAAFAKGDQTVNDRLLQDMLFFCAQAQGAESADAPALAAVREAFRMQKAEPVNYDVRRFGRFDPVLLGQARKRIAAAAETWSALAGGDRQKLKAAADQFNLVADSLRRLHPQSAPLAHALTQALESTARSGEPPATALAMEVATSILYLQAGYEELDTPDDVMAERAGLLAGRLDRARGAASPEPLEGWMEALYRRVSDRQTMGSVVEELRVTLREAEQSLDQFFRAPNDVGPLTAVPGHLAQMRGVLSVLGLDQASQAVVRMRECVERLLMGDPAEPIARTAVFDRLGNSLGALSFLIDMLGYQPTLARRLFVYDEQRGELRIVMGRSRVRASDDAPTPAADNRHPVPLPAVVPAENEPALHEPVQSAAAASPTAAAPVPEAAAAPVPVPVSAPVVPAASPAPAPEDDDAELREIFLEEAREVIENGLASVTSLESHPGDLSEQTTLRRAFHTLKGSSRMVQLDRFGEAAWAMEQVFNAWLAEQLPIPENHRVLARRALEAFGRWARDIENGQDGEWSPEPFVAAADALRLGGASVPLLVPGGDVPAAPGVPYQPVDPQGYEVSDASEEEWADTVMSEEEDSSDEPPDQATRESETAAPQPLIDADTLSFDAPPAEARAAAGLFVPDDYRAPDAADPAAPASSLLGEPFDAAAAVPKTPPDARNLQIDEVDFAEFTAALTESDRKAPDADGRSGAAEPKLAVRMSPAPIDDLPTVASAESPQPAFEGDLPTLSDEFLLLAEPEPAAAADAAPAAASGRPEAVPEAADATDGADAIPAGAGNTAPQAASPEPAESIQSVEGAVTGRADAPPADADEPSGASTPFDTLAAALPVLDDVVMGLDADDDVKVIESLRIPIPLYNVYLNEADEWSRRVLTTLGEWSLELHRRLPESAEQLAHSLAGSSATVGFEALSKVSRLLEHALQHVRNDQGTAHQAGVFVDAAEDIRHLLHQFAAGFLKEPRPRLMRALQAILDSDNSASDEVPSAASFLRVEDNDDHRMLAADADADADADAYAATDTDTDAGSHAGPEPVEPPAEPAATTPDEAAEPRLRAVADVSGESEEAAQRRIDDTIARAVGAGASLGDDIDVVDVIDTELFPFFEEEALELLPQLGNALRQWGARPENDRARAEVLRALHTLKGSARLAGAMQLGELAHRFETEIDELGPEVGDASAIEPLFAHADALRSNFEKLRAGTEVDADTPVRPAPAHAASVGELVEASGVASAAPVAVPGLGVTVPVRQPIAAAARSVAGPSVRVRSALLDRLVNQAGEVMISRSRLESRLGQMRGSLGDLTGNLERLRRELRDIEVQAESQMQSRLALAKDTAAGFDPLEFDRFTRVQELTRMMAESVDDVATVQRNLQRTMQGTEDELVAQGRQARELQRDLLRTRMVEFEGIADRLYAVARQAAKETGKPITLDITGGAVEMDRGVLERLAPAFEHLLRNAVVHGIEDAATRAAAGKPATGTITIGLHQEGNDVAVEFRDDGAGLDHDRIRAKARSLGLLDGLPEPDDAQAAQLIFQPGFSTATQVTELAGRGIGMDVVRTEVQASGGRIEIRSQKGEGTRFRLILPLTTAVTQVVMVRAGNVVFAVPATVVEVVRRATPVELDGAYASDTFTHDGEAVPFFWTGALLGSSDASHEPPARTRPVVVFRSAQQRLALHVDEVLGHQEVVVKNLGPQLVRLPGMSGMSVLPSGAVVLIYNPVALASVHGERVRAQLAVRREATAAQQAEDQTPAAPGLMHEANREVPLVLVVDDSITVRRVTQRLLRREGYRVALAADGLQALERLQEERPSLVLSDIEMPRMDGFDLARNIRADDQLRDLPIVMITSRIAAKHREHAMALGVNHYLGKPYPEEELLGLVRRYCLMAMPA
ncbi:hybrid sensor histidine kinase/response regulator [Xylophilus ampelinus]|uniref:Chemotaxis protein CheA n=1 Tax=Xylophilus ampelinus TaxID=54067 RepID=A0A318SET0_9BURK|nr:Hpt domain-containing protein [Xylophilus ampelinus]MCS4511521.1 Hpt domain-containing protein [Xylophilus ampelinus]PYE74356.1 chemosensory pili system protein ChpA (sensor histidine kinase/response regulator) [Xylophilus ampelinus]